MRKKKGWVTVFPSFFVCFCFSGTHAIHLFYVDYGNIASISMFVVGLQAMA